MELSDLLDSDTLEYMTDASTSEELMLAAYDSICEPWQHPPARGFGTNNRGAKKTVLTHDDHATDSTPFFAARVRKRYSQPATMSMPHKFYVSTYNILVPYARCNALKFSFFCTVIRLWNFLPLEALTAEQLLEFKHFISPLFLTP